MTLLLAFALFAAMPCCTVSVSVRTPAQQPVPAARVRAGDVEVQTDSSGGAVVPLPAPGRYTVEVTAPGFQPMRRDAEVASGAVVELEFLLTPSTTESITVEEKIASDASSSTLAPVTSEQMRRLPTDPPTVKDALPLIPGVVRTPEGRLRVSGGPEYRSTLLVNSLDVTDPATGKFGATIPIDSVESLNVFKSPFLAEYGRFTAAVVVVDTKRGGDKWHFELNDPTPELRLRSRHIRGVRGFTPRVFFSGPLLRNRLYLSQSAEYRVNKSPVFTLPFPENETWREQWNTLTQFDGILSMRHTVTATVHLVPQKVKFAGLSFYSPRPVTPDFRSHEFNASLKDRVEAGGGLLETALSATEMTGRTWGRSGSPMVLLPNVYSGAYFADQDRKARRLQWLETYSFTRGAHTWKFGTSLIHSSANGWFRGRGVSIRDLTGTEITSIAFRNAPGYRFNDLESGTYVHDHWQLRPAFSLDLGVRLDWQRITSTGRIAPRLGFAWAPFGESSTVLRGGVGWFYDRVPLSAYAWQSYPEQIIDGIALPNILGRGSPSGSLVFGDSAPGSFSPRSRAWSAQVEHRFGKPIRLRAGYLENDASQLLVIAPASPGVVLDNRGRSRYRQLEVISQFSFREGQEIFASYVRSAGRSNLNEWADWLGDLPAPVIRRDVYATSPANMPHRFLLWGVVPFDSRTRIAPVIEYRTGLPYSALNAAQQYEGEPNSLRFPNFLSIDFRVARDIHVKGHAVQLSFSMFNITNHWNPDAVRLNTADPQFGEFLGQHRRRFRLDFDFLF